MASQPVKWYWEVSRKYVLNADGGVVQVDDELPQAALTQRFTANLQLVKDTDLTPYTALDANVTFQAVIDDTFNVQPPLFELYGDDYDAWTLAGAGTAEYYYMAETISDKPQLVRIDGSDATEGTVGSLTAGEWGYDGTYLYVRLSDDTDPDTKAHGYVEQQPPGSSTQPYMQIFSSDINTAGSWYDDGTESFRNPDPANGEISLILDADKTRFYDRLNGEDKADTKLAIQVLDSGGEFQDVYLLDFICYDRRLPFEVADLKVDSPPYLTPSEIAAKYLEKVLWQAETPDYTAGESEAILFDVSAGAGTITFPSAPKVGAFVGVSDYYKNASTNNITLDRNGENIEGSASNYIMDVDGMTAVFGYSGATRGWVVVHKSYADDNIFTAGEESKLAGVESGATADQTDSEIKTAYENNADTNAYTDSEKTTVSNALVSGNNLSDVSRALSALANLYPRVASGAADLTATDTAGYAILAITDTAATRTVTIASANVAAGAHQIPKDESGNAGTNAITVNTEGSETIDGAASKTINTNYGVLRLYSDGTNWFTY